MEAGAEAESLHFQPERVNWKRLEHLNSQTPSSSSMITTSSKATPRTSSSSTYWSPSWEFAQSLGFPLFTGYIHALLISHAGTTWSKGPHIYASFWKFKSVLCFTSDFLMFKTEESHPDETLCNSLKRISSPQASPVCLSSQRLPPQVLQLSTVLAGVCRWSSKFKVTEITHSKKLPPS